MIILMATNTFNIGSGACRGVLRGEKGAQCPGRRITGGRRKVPTMLQVLSSIRYIWSWKTWGLEHGGAKLISCPWRHLTSVCPWAHWNSLTGLWCSQYGSKCRLSGEKVVKLIGRCLSAPRKSELFPAFAACFFEVLYLCLLKGMISQFKEKLV